MPSEDVFRLDRRALRQSFNRSAQGYDAVAVLQREVGARLMERLELTTLTPARILDLGCGTGHQMRTLFAHYPRAQVLGMDIALGMLTMARRSQGWFRRRPLVCADALRLPFAASSFDLVYCNLMLQWCDDLDQVFRELRRVLTPHGLLLFSSFGPDTLGELRRAWREVDDFNHVNRFIDMHDIGDALIRAGFAEPVMDVEHITLTYDDVRALMRDLKGIGAHNVTAGRARTLGGRRRIQQLAAAYETFRRESRLPATYEVIYGTAWTPSWMPADLLTEHERHTALAGASRTGQQG